MALFTVYEAHTTFDKYRTKVSQVLVLPTYQRRGIASRVYDLIYAEYRENDSRCFQLMVEDAADDFQKLQDISHAKILRRTLQDLSQEQGHQRAYLPVASSTITTAEQVRDR